MVRGRIPKANKMSIPLKRLAMLLCLLPILAAWGVLIFRVPVLSAGSRSGTSVFVIPDREIVILEHDQSTGWCSQATWRTQHAVFDLQDGTIEAIELQEAQQLYRAVPKRDWARLERSGSQTSYLFTSYDGKSGVEKQKRTFEFPVYPILVGDEFAVGSDVLRFFVMDMYGIEPSWVSFKKDTEADHTCFQLGQSNRFLCLNESTSWEKTCELQIFKVDGLVKPVCIASWEARSGKYGQFGFTDQIATLDKSGRKIEFRSLDDGSVVDSVPLPEEVDADKNEWYFSDQYFSNEPSVGGYHLDLKSKDWIPTTEGWLVKDSPRSDKYGLVDFNDGACNWHVVRRGSGEVVSKISGTTAVKFLNNDSLISWTPYWGCTIQKIRASSGVVSKTWRPFLFVIPLLCLSIVSYLVWSYWWLKLDDPKVSVWLDIGLVGILPLIALSLRIHFSGDSEALFRSPRHFVYGIYIAWLTTTVVWLFYSGQRIAVGVLPFIVATALLLVLIATGLVVAPANELSTLILTLLPFVIFIWTAQLGVNVKRKNPIQDSPSEKSKQDTNPFTFSIADLMLLMTGIALILGAFGLVLPTEARIDWRTIIWLQPLVWVAIASALAGLYCGFKFQMDRRRLNVIVAVCLIVLVAEASYPFVFGHHLWNSVGIRFLIETLRSSMTGFLAAFWFSLAFRFRGWRLEFDA